MMEVVLTRLRDFSCKTSTFDDSKPAGQSACRDPAGQSACRDPAGQSACRDPAGQSACRDPRSRTDRLSEDCTVEEEGRKLDLESALAWLRRELMEMRSQDQALIRQLMELHYGIQELKQELSEEEQEEETESEEEEEDNYWDCDSERGSGSVYCSSREMGFGSLLKMPRSLYPRALLKKASCRRSSVP